MAETTPQQQEIPGIPVPGEVIPEGKQEAQVENDAPKYTAIELRAIEQGWRPKEEWDGPEEDWRDAKAYIDRGELLGKLKTQSAELKEVKNMLGYMSEHNKKVYAAGYQKAIVDLKAARIAAMKDENFEAVAAIEEQIDQNKEALQQIQRQPPAVQQPKGIDKELERQWLDKNSWYKTDPAMKHWANGMAFDYKRVNPEADEAEIYEHLTREVRKTFPHKFRRAGAPNPDGEGRQTNQTGSSKSSDGDFDKLMASMPEDQARVARQMVKSGLVTKAKYVEDYTLIGGR